MKSAIVVTFMRVLLVLSILGGFLYYFWVKIYSFYLVMLMAGSKSSSTRTDSANSVISVWAVGRYWSFLIYIIKVTVCVCVFGSI